MRLRSSPASLWFAVGLCVSVGAGVTGCSKKEATPVEASAPGAATAPQAATADAPGADAPAAGMRPEPTDGPMTKAAMLARSDERFDRMDADHDGVLSAAELSAATEGRPGGPGGQGRGGGRGFARADADGDGRITRAEARAAAEERFARMDANGDGVISDDERPQWGGRGGH